MSIEIVGDRSIEKIGIEYKQISAGKNKLNVRSRLRKCANVSIKVIALAIVAIFIFTALAAATQVSYTLDAEKDLPKTFEFDFYQQVSIDIINIKKPSGIVLRFETPVELDVYIGDFKTVKVVPEKQNLIVFGASEAASINFATVSGVKLRVEKTNSPIPITEDTIVTGETWEEHANGEWYAAEFDLTALAKENINVDITYASKDIYYLTITNGSISIFGLHDQTGYTNIPVYPDTEIFRVMSKNEPAEFTLEIDPPIRRVANTLPSNNLLLTIDKTLFASLMEEKTFPLNLQNTSQKLKTSIEQLDKACKEAEKEKYTNANQWLQKAVNNITAVEQQLDAKHIGMKYQLKTIYSYLLSVDCINASTKEDALRKINKSIDYIECMFLYIYNPSVKVKPIKEKLENVRDDLSKKKDANLTSIIEDLNVTIDILTKCLDKENKNVILEPIFILYWLEMVKKELDSIIEKYNNNLNGASNLLKQVIDELNVTVEAPTAEEELNAIIASLKTIDYTDLENELNGIINRIENILEHLDDGASVKKLERIKEWLEEIEDEYDDDETDTSALQQEIDGIIKELEDVLTTIKGIPIKFDSVMTYELKDDDNDTVPKVVLNLKDVWLKSTPYPVYITVDNTRNINLGDSWRVNYIRDSIATVGDTNDNDSTIPACPPDTIMIGRVIISVKYLEDIATGYPIVMLNEKVEELKQTSSYSLTSTENTTLTVIKAPFSAKITDVDQDGQANNIEYTMGTNAGKSDTDDDGVSDTREFSYRSAYTKMRDKDYTDAINITRYLKESPVLKEICNKSTFFLSTFDAEAVFSISLVGGNYTTYEALVNGQSVRGVNPNDAGYNTTLSLYNFTIVTYALIDTANESRIERAIEIEFSNNTLTPTKVHNYTANKTFIDKNNNVSGYICNYTFNLVLVAGNYNITLRMSKEAFSNTSYILLMPQKIITDKSFTNANDCDTDIDKLHDGEHRTLQSASNDAQTLLNAGIRYIDLGDGSYTFLGEISYGTSPTKVDTDNDHFWDSAEVDFWSIMYDLHRTNDADKISENVTRSDYDNDSMLDGDEIIFYTNITDPDSDDDGLSDFDEVFQYFRDAKLEVENNFVPSETNATKVDAGLLLSSNYSTAELTNIYIPETGLYRVKVVGESCINVTTNQYDISSTINKLNTTGVWYDAGYKAIPDEKLSGATDKIIGNAVSMDSSTGSKTTGCMALELIPPYQKNYLDTRQGRYISLYDTWCEGFHSITYTLPRIENTVQNDTNLLLDYVVVERQGLDPWNPDTDDDGVMDGDEVIKYSTSPWLKDTDGDGIYDAEEIAAFTMPKIVANHNFAQTHTSQTGASIPLLGNGESVAINYASITLDGLDGSWYTSLTDGYMVEPSVGYRAVDAGDTIHLVWSDDRTGSFQIYYATSTDNGKTWSDAIMVSASSARHQCVQPDISVDETGNAHIVWKEIEPGHMQPGVPRLPWIHWWMYKYDGNVFALESNGVEVNPNEGFQLLKDDLGYKFEPIDTALISEIIKDGYLFKWVWVPGCNWIKYRNMSCSDTITLREGTNDVSAYPHIAAANGYLHVTFSEAYIPSPVGPWPQYIPPGSIRYTQSTDDGISWSSPTTIGSTETGGPNPNTIADADGHVYVAWESNPYQYGTDLWLATSDSSGATWGTPIRLVDKSFEPISPALAAGDGYIYLAYAANYNYNYEICYLKSTNYGKDWSAPFRITNEIDISTNPQIDIDNINQNVHFVWQDHREGTWRVYYELRDILSDSVIIDDALVSANDSVNPSIVVNSLPHIVWQCLETGSKIYTRIYDPELVPQNIKVYVGSLLVFEYTGSLSGIATVDITDEVRNYVVTKPIASEEKKLEILRFLSATNYTGLDLDKNIFSVPITMVGDSGVLKTTVTLNIGAAQFYMSSKGSDEDGDGLSDQFELGYPYTGKPDCSIVTNPLSADTDNDGITDWEETYAGTDGYITNPLKPDTDSDGIPDKWEIEHGISPLVYDRNIDYDGDGLANIQEFNLETHPQEIDTDEDKLTDSEELLDITLRTSIENGAVSISSYNAAITEDWIYYKDRTWAEGKAYAFSHKELNVVETTEGWYLNPNNSLVLTLDDGTEIYINANEDRIYVWEPQGISSRSYYQFDFTTIAPVISSSLPVGGYKNKELFYGPNPIKNDTDNDGVLDGLEYYWTADSDADGAINCLDRDSDSDSLLDGQEALSALEQPYDWYCGKNDLDGDYIPNMADLDSDNDMIPDRIELMPLSDTDNDGLPNFIDTDSDNDTLWDSFEDKNGNGICDPDELGEDINYNGIIDVGETSPIRKDSDNDLLSDWSEIASVAYWFEAESENYVTGTVVNDSFASSGKSATSPVTPDGFRDDFETGTLDKWVVEPEYTWETPVTVVSAPGHPAYDGTYSARFYGYGSALLTPQTFSPVEKGIVSVEFAVNWTGRGSVSNFFYFYGADGKASYIEFMITGPEDKFEIRWFPDADDPYSSYLLLQEGDINTWYYFQLYLNLDDKNVKIFINNIEREAGNLTTALDCFRTWGFWYMGMNTEIYLDSVNVNTLPSIASISYSVQPDLYAIYIRAKVAPNITTATITIWMGANIVNFNITGGYKWYYGGECTVENALSLAILGADVCVDKIVVAKSIHRTVTLSDTFTLYQPGEQPFFTDVFQDDFETGALDKWTIEQQYSWETPVTVLSAPDYPVYNGSYSTRFYGQGYAILTPQTFSPIEKGVVSVEFAVNYTTRGTACNFFYFYGADGKTSCIEFLLAVDQSKCEIRWYPDIDDYTSSYLLQVGDINTWYYFQIYLNLDDKNVKIFINNVEREAGNLTTALDCFRTWGFWYMGMSTELYLDNVKVKEGIIDLETIRPQIPIYAKNATIMFALSNPDNITIYLDENIAWKSTSPLTNDTVDISYILNQYLSTHTDWRIPLKFNLTSSNTMIIQINIELQSYFIDPLDSDTDDDGLNDGDELQVAETDGILNKYFTDPLNPDTDRDTLLDGQEMKGWYIMVENGKEENLVHVTSNPLRLDSDNDGLLDTEEIYNAVYWLAEAEDYRINDTQLRDNNTAITNKTGTNEIFNITLTIPKGTYKYYVKAKGETTLNLTVNCSGVFINEKFNLTDEYGWYSTSAFSVINRTITLFAFGNTFIDKIILVRDNTTIINAFSDGSYEKTLIFDSTGNQTVNISIPLSTEPTYVESAEMDIRGLPKTTGVDSCTSGLWSWLGCGSNTTFRVYITHTGALKRLEMIVANGTGASVRFHVWMDESGEPGKEIAYSEIVKVPAASPEDIWVEGNFTSGAISTPGYYWIGTTHVEMGDSMVNIRVVNDGDPETYYEPYGSTTHYANWDCLFKLETGVYPTTPYFCFEGDTDTIWSWVGVFDTKITMDFATSLNQYLLRHNDSDDGTVDGYITVPLMFHSASTGNLSLTNIRIEIKTFATNPMNPDTDYDGLYDGDEIQWFEKDGVENLYPSNPADYDTDDDLLSDGKEIMGWDITVEAGAFNIREDINLLSSVVTTPLVYDEKLFVGCANGKVYAIDGTNFNIIWESPQLNGNISKYLSLDSDGIYVTTCIYTGIPTNGTIYKLSIKNGTILWSYQNGDAIVGGIDDGLVFVGYRGGYADDGYIVALNKTTGSKVWGPIWITAFATALPALWAINNHIVYVTGSASSSVAFTAINYNGTSIWTDSIMCANHGNYVIVDDSSVFTLYAAPDYNQTFSIKIYNAATGNITGIYPVSKGQPHFAVSPDKIIVTNDTGVFAYSRYNFTLLWSCPLVAGAYTEQPIVTQDTVIVVAKDNTVVFISLATGEIYRTEKLNANMTSPLSFVCGPSGGIYVGTTSGIVKISFSTTGDASNWISYGGNFRHTGFVNCSRAVTYVHTVHVTSDPRNMDTDGDLIVDFLEYKFTNASNQDTDADGLTDNLEYNVVFRTNATDIDNDGKNDYISGTWIALKLDPNIELDKFYYNRIAPNIISTTPANGATNVSLNQNIIIVFSEKMNTSSVCYTSFFDPGGWVSSWNAGNDTLMLAHSDFSPGTTYTFNVTAGKDVAGNDLFPGSVPNPWSFTTATTGVRAMPINLTTTKSNDDPVLARTSVPDARRWIQLPYTTPEGFEIYKSFDGTKVVIKTLSTYIIYTTSPNIISITPANGATDVAVNQSIIVIFSEKMNTSSVLYTCFPNPSGWTSSWNAANDTLTLTHNNFNSGTTYTFNVTAGKDVAGNNLVSGIVPNPWAFIAQAGALPSAPTNISLTSGNDILYPKPMLPFAYNRQETYAAWTDPTNIDTDSDGIPDGWIDGWFNGTIMPENIDGIRTMFEGEDLDCDGIFEPGWTGYPVGDYGPETNPTSSDTDTDTIDDLTELLYYSIDIDSDGFITPVDVDSDNDLLLDGYNVTIEATDWNFGLFNQNNIIYEQQGSDYTFVGELSIGTDPFDWDTDDDNLGDGYELKGFQFTTSYIDANGNIVSVSKFIKLNPLSIDTDGDRLLEGYNITVPNGSAPYHYFMSYNIVHTRLANDSYVFIGELSIGTDPIVWDTDGGGLPDGYEIQYKMKPLDARDELGDYDCDGLTNVDEVTIYGTNMDHWDSDGDGLPDGWEVKYGLDAKSSNNATQDLDNDGLNNAPEYRYNIPSTWIDANGNLLATSYTRDGGSPISGLRLTYGVWWNGTNPIHWDTDSDGMPDGYETSFSLDPRNNDAGLDKDKDGLTNLEEYRYKITVNYDPICYTTTITYTAVYDSTTTVLSVMTSVHKLQSGIYLAGLNLTDWDSDNDRLPDGWEVKYELDPKSNTGDNGAGGDPDKDALNNLAEYIYNIPVSQDVQTISTDGTLTNGIYWSGIDPKNWDTDGDKLPDGWEVNYNLNPLSNDANGDKDADGLTNLQEYQYNRPSTWDESIRGVYWDGLDPADDDTDNDNMPDGWEVKYGLNPKSNDAGLDKDKDGLKNADEYTYKTDPTNPDTDGDGMPDGYEVQYGLNPILDDANSDLDNDDLVNIDEYKIGTYPNDEDWDDDNLKDGKEVELDTDPFKPDTDGDGLEDGDEIKGQAIIDSIQYTFNPTIPTMDDSDMDGLNDKYEVVNTYTESETDWNNDGIIDYTTDTMNPDTDNDGITDGLEVTGWRTVIGYAVGETIHTDEREFISNPLASLKNDYIYDKLGKKYYNGNDLDEDHIPDDYEIQEMAKDPENKQYNPFIRENIPPEITYVSVETFEQGPWYAREYWTRVYACVNDVAGVKYSYIDVYGHQWNDWYLTPTDGKYSTGIGWGVAVNIGWWAAKVSGYDVVVGAKDVNDNFIKVSRSCGTWWTEFAAYVEGGLDWLSQWITAYFVWAWDTAKTIGTYLRVFVKALEFFSKFPGLDSDTDDIPDLAEWIIGTDPNKQTLLLEIDYMDGFEPTPEARDYFVNYYTERGYEIKFEMDEKLSHVEITSRAQIDRCWATHHWKPYNVYVLYVDKLESGLSEGEGLGFASFITGVVVALGQIKQEKTDKAKQIKWEEAVLMHEVGHCIWIWEHTGIPPVEVYCTHKDPSTGTYDCVMSGRNWDDIFDPAYCSSCWAKRSLFRKWGV